MVKYRARIYTRGGFRQFIVQKVSIILESFRRELTLPNVGDGAFETQILPKLNIALLLSARKIGQCERFVERDNLIQQWKRVTLFGLGEIMKGNGEGNVV